MEERNGPTPERMDYNSSVSSWFSNPFLANLFNHQDITKLGPLRQVLHQLCHNSDDYAILVPPTFYLTFHRDSNTGKSYVEMCKDIDFILSHVIRINVFKDKRIRSHNEYTTLNNKVLTIKNDEISTLRNFKCPVSVKILNQEFIRGFATYIPIGTCFHVIYISQTLYKRAESITPEKSLLFEPNLSGLVKTRQTKLGGNKLYSREAFKVVPFKTLLQEYPSLLKISKMFDALFAENLFKACKTSKALDESFNIVMKRGSAMMNTLEPNVLRNIMSKYSEDNLKESIYEYLEMNIYEKFWARFVKLNGCVDDDSLTLAYNKLKWLSITQVGLPDPIVHNQDNLLGYIERVILAINEFKLLSFATTSSKKHKILVKTIDHLSQGSFIDADLLITLVIFVICLSKVPNLNNQMNYIKKYTYCDSKLENGALGYVLSTFDVSLKFFHNAENMNSLVRKSLQTEVLWKLVGSVSSDHAYNAIKDDNELTFQQIESLLMPYNKSDCAISTDCFVKSRTLSGDSCLMASLKRLNAELMRVMLQFDYIFTLDDILEDRNLDGTNLLAAALELKHPSSECIAQIILQASPEEITEYINRKNQKGRTIGHYIYNSHNLIIELGKYIDWTIKDKSGNTPLTSCLRSYDHTHYVDLVKVLLPTVKKWYIDQRKPFNHRDHLDNKRNSLLHVIRDAATLQLFLHMFDGLETNCLNEANQSAVSLSIRYNRIGSLKVLLAEPSICLSIVDPQMYMSSLDYVKLERWGEPLNREIAKILEMKFVQTEYGQDLKIACVRARFDSDQGLCCYFRVVYNDSKSDIIYVPFSSVTKAFKLMKKENLSIPFDFNAPDIWFPRHGYVGMKGNICSSNKMRINTLVNNINLLIQALYQNGTMAYTQTLQNYLFADQPEGKLEINILNERNVLKLIYSKSTGLRKNTLNEVSSFKRMLVTAEDILTYEAFTTYTASELEAFLKIYGDFYRFFTLSDVESKDLDKLKTEIPWIVEKNLKWRESRVEDSSDIFLDKMRLLYASTEALIKTSNDLKLNKIRRWKKIVADFRNLRSELDRVCGSGVEGFLGPAVVNDNETPAELKRNNRKEVLSKVFKQIDILTGNSESYHDIEQLIEDLSHAILNDRSNFKPDETSGSTKNGNGVLLESLIYSVNEGVNVWFSDKRRTAYVKKLLDSFLGYRLELLDLNIELKRTYESLAIFMSKFYDFRAASFKFAFKDYTRGKIGELKRELQGWNLGLLEYRDKLDKSDK